MATNPETLFRAAIEARKSGFSDEATRLFRKITEDHPNSPQAADARAYLRGFDTAFASVKPGVASAPPGMFPISIQSVRVVDVDIKFTTMVGLFIKAAFAAIPAAIIVGVIWAFIYAVFMIGVVGVTR